MAPGCESRVDQADKIRFKCDEKCAKSNKFVRNGVSCDCCDHWYHCHCVNYDMDIVNNKPEDECHCGSCLENGESNLHANKDAEVINNSLQKIIDTLHTDIPKLKKETEVLKTPVEELTSHGRGLAMKVLHKINDVDVQGLVKPVTAQLTKNDLVVIDAGGNDIYKTQAVNVTKNMERLLLKMSHTNVAICNISPRHDLTSSSCVNRAIHDTNEKIKHICSRYSFVEVIDVFTYPKTFLLARSAYQ
ncbi:hypothetical protein PR048_015169 [Dryococelus australis]|uniref:PHD-type domain-containing protein n=1 Tax=Dryococelus australis TaxID=614101 RepID=A0ABQ9HGP8_9NEOP|nr:hypothetical protein PR048_015169 [Dryococelus australis]